MIDSVLRARVESWIADDPDEDDRAELRGLLDAAGSAGQPGSDTLPESTGAKRDGTGAERELADRFAGRLEFGTAGLRGRIGAGPNRINRAVVRATTAAVTGWLRDGRPPGPPSVVIGCDARHRSREFADEAAAVCAAAGLRVHLLPRPCPTPLLAFAVRHLSVRAGIMITASHNQAADNGYKLYVGDGAQIIPPTDAEISGRIERLGPLAEVPVTGLGSPLVTLHGDEIAKAYLRAVTARLAEAAGRGPRGFAQPGGSGRPPLTVVYTPLHGVAGALMLRAIERAGLAVPHVVKAQADPDPDFPTVAFPNPEEPGALDLAFKDAASVGADLVLASDPDGDRLAVAVPEDEPGPEPGGWRQLTGDQLGALLGAYLLRREVPGPDDPRVPLVATTIVSSTLLRKIAAAAGAEYVETLTGFKWISRAGDAGRAGSQFVFGYEEALGYMVGQTVRDKDGIGAALAVLAMAAEAKAAGRTLLEWYDDLEREHGVHLTAHLSLRIPGTAAVMRRIRSAPPASLGGLPVTGVMDYAKSAAPAMLSGGTSPGSTGLPPSDVLRFTLDGARVIVRPSGTESKIKAYLEVVQPVPDTGSPDTGSPDTGGLAAARAAARERIAPLRAAVADLLTKGLDL
jgi:phosphomannomutase